MTRKLLLIAGVAGLALTAPVAAEKGGRGDDKPPKAEAQQGGGEQPPRQERQAQERQAKAPRAERPQAQRMERPQREPQMQRAERPQIQRIERSQRIEQVQRAERPQRVERMDRPQRAERPQVQRVERQQSRTERQVNRIERKALRVERPPVQRELRQWVERTAKTERQQQKRIERQTQRVERNVRVERRDMLRATPQFDRQQSKTERRMAKQMFRTPSDDRGVVTAVRFDGSGYRPLATLFAGRDIRPMKPFKAKFDDRQYVSIGERLDDSRVLTSVPLLFASRYVDTPDYYHRYDDDLGYVYRVNRDDGIVRSLIPLFGGYGIGDPWPATYYSSYVPLGYRDYYYDTPDYHYRNDGYGIYQVDSSTQLITALVALLTGQGFGIGQMLPASYGAYNVPLQYRSSYYDTDDSWYRYGDGFIYQVDTDSRRVAARYPIYADDYYVGDAWPVAYPDYNVPYGYQSLYYDTPQEHYRYANGGIYQVDPTNQMILALVALLTGDKFAVGQQMPNGYDMYNVPLAYRDRYADSDDEWYRYANGYVYEVDPRSGLIEEAFPVYV